MEPRQTSNLWSSCLQPEYTRIRSIVSATNIHLRIFIFSQEICLGIRVLCCLVIYMIRMYGFWVRAPSVRTTQLPGPRTAWLPVHPCWHGGGHTCNSITVPTSDPRVWEGRGKQQGAISVPASQRQALHFPSHSPSSRGTVTRRCLPSLLGPFTRVPTYETWMASNG